MRCYDTLCGTVDFIGSRGNLQEFSVSPKKDREPEINKKRDLGVELPAPGRGWVVITENLKAAVNWKTESDSPTKQGPFQGS